jgi:hypothetical protein
LLARSLIRYPQRLPFRPEWPRAVLQEAWRDGARGRSKNLPIGGIQRSGPLMSFLRRLYHAMNSGPCVDSGMILGPMETEIT